MLQMLLKNRWAMALITFILATGWLATIAFVGYGLYEKALSFSDLVTAVTGIISALFAGGGVHFIWQKVSGNSNGHSTSAPAAN